MRYGISNIRELFGAKMDVQNHKVNTDFAMCGLLIEREIRRFFIVVTD